MHKKKTTEQQPGVQSQLHRISRSLTAFTLYRWWHREAAWLKCVVWPGFVSSDFCCGCYHRKSPWLKPLFGIYMGYNSIYKYGRIFYMGYNSMFLGYSTETYSRHIESYIWQSWTCPSFSTRVCLKINGRCCFILGVSRAFHWSFLQDDDSFSSNDPSNWILNSQPQERVEQEPTSMLFFRVFIEWLDSSLVWVANNLHVHHLFSPITGRFPFDSYIVPLGT